MEMSHSRMVRLTWLGFTGAMTNTETPSMSSENLTLVLGATGTTGRRVAARLVARGVPVRLGSRSGTPPFDWADETTWAPVLHGVSAAYLVSRVSQFLPQQAAAGRR
jgi:hypothetical protein